MQARIRQATPADIPAIQRIFAYGDAHHRSQAPWFFAEHAGPARSSEYLLQNLASDSALILVAQGPDTEPVGLLHLFVRTSPEVPFLAPRRYAVVDALIVLPEAQRAGIGAALMREAEVWAQEHDIHEMELSVWEFNAPAQRLYERLGYVTTRRSMWKLLPARVQEGDE
jgi:ribosomal protein S18 acetylase RimI-like enzyme